MWEENRMDRLNGENTNGLYSGLGFNTFWDICVKILIINSGYIRFLKHEFVGGGGRGYHLPAYEAYCTEYSIKCWRSVQDK